MLTRLPELIYLAHRSNARLTPGLFHSNFRGANSLAAGKASLALTALDNITSDLVGPK